MVPAERRRAAMLRDVTGPQSVFIRLHLGGRRRDEM